MPRDSWNPEQYNRFGDERSQPFYDLLAMVEPLPGGRAYDLGCGTGELTKRLHEATGAHETIGVDSSDAMLAKSAEFAGDGLRFEKVDVSVFNPPDAPDLLFSNAMLQWLPDHESLFPRLAGLVAPGGQFAVQIPANHDHPSHVIAHKLAAEEPHRTVLKGYIRESPLMPPAWYAEMLHKAGFKPQSVRMNVYGHYLDSAQGVVEWCKGTLLTDYQRRMPPADYDRYVHDYAARLLPALEDSSPFFFPFKRILMWGRKRD